jgi:hypothetical protein
MTKEVREGFDMVGGGRNGLTEVSCGGEDEVVSFE